MINPSQFSHGNYSGGAGLSNTYNQLSSGSRINSAADDAAGLQQAERLGRSVQQSNVLSRNSEDQISLNQISEGYLSGALDGVSRLRELVLQSGNPLGEKGALQPEVDAIANSVNELANSALGEEGVLGGVDLSGSVEENLATLDGLQDRFLSEASTLGADSNALTARISNYEVSSINASAARSRISDTDYAEVVAQMKQEETQQQVAITLQKQKNDQLGSIIDKLI